jgi:hypothetical protein
LSGSVEDVWTSLTRPQHGLSAQLHPESPCVWLALDSSNRRHLLVRASGREAGTILMVTRGLHAETAEISVESGPLDVWADISCTDRSLNRTFLTLAEDLVADTANSADPLAAVQQTLRTWQWFWGVDTDALTEAGALGLFGEMWFLDRWAPFPNAVANWHGPDADRHDFSSPTVAVEVKTTRSHGVGAPRHHIATLDQLQEPLTGSLYLFSVQAIPESNAGNTLPALISRLRSRLTTRVDLLGELDQGLARLGWSPALSDRHQTSYRVAAERLYRVEGTFPRLIRTSFLDGVPDGVDDIGYSIALAACAPWLAASTPAEGLPILSGLA